MKKIFGSSMIFNAPVSSISQGDIVMSCNSFFGDSDIIKGSGKIASESRQVEHPFTALEVFGSATVEVNISEMFTIDVTGDDNLIGLLETKISGGSLCVTVTKGSSFMTQQALKVVVTMPLIDSVELQGSGDVFLSGLNQENINIELRGSGDVFAIGSVANMELRLQGSGNIDARKLRADRATIKLQGSGDVRALVTESVKVRLQGSGDVEVYGSPKSRDSKSTGSGDIDFID